MDEDKKTVPIKTTLHKQLSEAVKKGDFKKAARIRESLKNLK